MRIYPSLLRSDIPNEVHVRSSELATYIRPTKQQIRDWLLSEVAKKAPPPPLDDVRRLLWCLVEIDPNSNDTEV